MEPKTETFVDDIVKALAIKGETAKFANISQETAGEFFTDNLKEPSVPQQTLASPVTAPVQQQSAPGMTFPAVTPTIPQVPQEKVQAPVLAPGSAPAIQPSPEVPVVGLSAQSPIVQPPEIGASELQPIAPDPQAAASAFVPSVQPVETNDFSQLDMQTLQGLAHQCSKCELHKVRKNVVFGTGNTHADLMFIGEGPGRDEDIQGIPFVGEAGQLLTRMINAMQFQRSEVYIANIIKCRPPNNRNPEDIEAETCLPYLKRQIQLINPKVIVVLGAVPLKYLLGKTGITKRRGVWDNFEGIQVMPTFHPAYLLRNASAKKQVWEDLQKVMQAFGRSYSPVQKR